MADIKQAAKWMQEDKRIRRTIWPPLYVWRVIARQPPVVTLALGDFGPKQDAMFGIDDLLADDWEIAE